LKGEKNRMYVFKNRKTSHFLKCFLKISLVFLIFVMPKRAKSEYLNLSLDGSYTKNNSQYSTTLRRSWGLSIGVPVTKFFEIELGHSYTDDKTIYNSDYRSLLESKGVFLENPEISSTQQIQDYSLNGALGFPFKFVRPSVFGGALRRKVCNETPFEDEGCSEQKIVWNAGLSLQTYITQSLRFKTSYRISPSTTNEKKKNKLDELISVGISWGI
jgi:hypothetical protein